MDDDTNGSNQNGENGRTVPPREAASGAGGEDLPFETIFWVLGNERRLRLLVVLDRLGRTATTVDELAEHVSELEERGSRTDVHATRQVRLSLYHVHVPKLAETGLVEYDESTGQLVYNGSDRLERVLALVETDDLSS